MEKLIQFNKMAATTSEPKEELKKHLNRQRGGFANFWVSSEDFKIFNTPCGIMYDYDMLKHVAKSYSMEYIISYDINSRNSCSIIDISDKRYPKSEKLTPPAVMIYHHDGIFFEYIIPQ